MKNLYFTKVNAIGISLVILAPILCLSGCSNNSGGSEQTIKQQETAMMGHPSPSNLALIKQHNAKATQEQQYMNQYMAGHGGPPKSSGMNP